MIDIKMRINNKLWRKCRLFSGSPEQMETTCGIRAKIKGLAQNFGLIDLNDNRFFGFSGTNGHDM